MYRSIGAILAVALLGLPGCARINLQKASPQEAAMIMGPAARANLTPMEPAFACMADKFAGVRKSAMTIAVGDVKDYTGKYNINEGNAVTQGGALMVYSALGKFGATVRIAERFDTHIAEMELGYIDRRQLGDGFIHALDPTGKQVVPWLPYYGGSIMRSDFYIVGGITELNYDIQSGGGLLQVNQLGPQARVFTENIAVDLRIVNSRTLTVVKTISFEKQLTGSEIGFNIFRFFGSSLWDVDIGAKGQEAAQLGIRTALEEATLHLIGAVSGISAEPCIAGLPYNIPDKSAAELRTIPDEPPVVPAAASPGTAVPAAPNAGESAVTPGEPGQVPTGPAQNIGDADESQRNFKVLFDFGSTDLPGATLTTMNRIATVSARGTALVSVQARDTENWDPGRRGQLIRSRVQAITNALRQRGVPPSAVVVDWQPADTDTGIYRSSAGFQEIARLHVQQ